MANISFTEGGWQIQYILCTNDKSEDLGKEIRSQKAFPNRMKQLQRQTNLGSKILSGMPRETGELSHSIYVAQKVLLNQIQIQIPKHTSLFTVFN